MNDLGSPGFIPRRHGLQREQTRNMLGLLRWLVPRAEPTPERWQAIGEALMHGDEPMDRLVAWMFQAGMKAARGQFELALERGIAAVPDAPAPLREFFARVDARPEWVDEQLLRDGARAHQRGGAEAIHVARDVALVGGYQASAFNRTLLLTGALQKGPARRFAETLAWALDCTGDGGLERFGAGFKSTLRVRLIHALVRRHVRALPEWRMAEWGLPINQPDMAATLLGALTMPMLGSQVLGVVVRRQEADAANHLNRYVGWLMGVQERWLPRSHGDALRLLYQFLLSMTNPDETSPQMAVPMIDEPFQRPYDNFAGLRARFERARHLSISRAFLGRQGMRNLGMPTRVLPWYPALALPRNLLRSAIARVLPGGLERRARAGRHEGVALLESLTPKHAPAAVGEAAQRFTHAG